MKNFKNSSKRNVLKLFVIAAIGLLFGGVAWTSSAHRNNNSATNIVKIEPNEAVSKAAFLDAAAVFFSPRCANCHPSGNSPTQGDAMLPHAQLVVRGTEGKGKYGMKCNTCHQAENLEGEKMPPGVPNWHMPPDNMKMVFQGLTAKQLCEQLKNPKLNGGRKTIAEAIEHLEKDPLVHWAWSPGNGRTLPPLSYEEFMSKVKEWEENGGACPDK